MGIITVYINLNTVGSDTGPFDVYDNYTGLILSNISRQELINGLAVDIREQASQIEIVSKGICNNNIIIPIQTFPPSPTPTATPSVSISITPSITPSISITPSVTPSVMASITPSISISVTPSITPSISISSTATPSLTPSTTPSISVTSTPTPTLTPSETPTNTPTLTPSATPTYTPTQTPTFTPTNTPTPTPTPTDSSPKITCIQQSSTTSYVQGGCSSNYVSTYEYVTIALKDQFNNPIAAPAGGITVQIPYTYQSYDDYEGSSSGDAIGNYTIPAGQSQIIIPFANYETVSCVIAGCNGNCYNSVYPGGLIAASVPNLLYCGTSTVIPLIGSTPSPSPTPQSPSPTPSPSVGSTFTLYYSFSEDPFTQGSFQIYVNGDLIISLNNSGFGNIEVPQGATVDVSVASFAGLPDFAGTSLSISDNNSTVIYSANTCDSPASNQYSGPITLGGNNYDITAFAGIC